MSFQGPIQQAMTNVVPWFLRRPNIGRFLEAVSFELDLSNETLELGLKQTRPYDCDVSALPILSKDRKIRLYDTEPEASKRFRLAQWRQLRRQRGTHQGEMRNIQPFFLPGPLPLMRTVHRSPSGRVTWHELAPDGTYSWSRATTDNWNWDGQTAQWSRSYTIIYVDKLGFNQPTWDGGQDWDGGSVWDGLFTSAQIADLVAGIKEAKGAHTKLWALILATDPTSFDPSSAVVVDPAGWSNLPNGKWGFTIDNITGKPSRLPGATFAYDLGQG